MTDEELLVKAAEERAVIVLKYDRGREEGAQIDPWEDPSFEIYHVTDRYGFIHEKGLPDYHQEEKNREQENRRLKKWLKIHKLENWAKEMKTGKLRKRVFKGIPDAIRGEIWSRLLHIKVTKEQQQGKYEEMRHLARLWSPDLRQIDLDVNRTYRDHLMFRERYGIKQQALFHVLAAYSVYNSEIGYCQGMSQIAALLLMYLNEEDAFWGLSNLMADKKWAMHGFFIPGFPKLIRFQEHHDKVLTKLLPKLKKHLDKQSIDAGLYTLKWFFQCFLDRVPFSLTLRLWDIYLLEGEKVLISMSYALLKMHRRTLSRLSMEDIVEFLQIRLGHDFGYRDDDVIENLDKCMEELRRMKLELTGTIPANELPQKPFGVFITPSIEASIGRRRVEFTDEEKFARAAVMARLELQSRSQQQGSYLSIDDASLDPSIDDVSSGVQRSSISSLAGTSATSAADISTISATASQRFLGNDDDIRSLSRGSLVSFEKDRNDADSGQQTPTVVTENAIIHFNHQDEPGPPPFPTPTTSPITSLETPTYPAPPPLTPGILKSPQDEDRHFGSRGQGKTVSDHHTYRSLSPDRVRIYVPFSENSVEDTAVMNGTPNGPIPTGTSPSLSDPNRVVIRIERTDSIGSSSKHGSKSPSAKVLSSSDITGSYL